MQDTAIQLQPIVNGGFNHEMSNEQMLSFDFEAKKRMAWSFIVSMGFAHSFRDIDYAVFVNVPSQYTHDMLVQERIDDILVTVRTEYQQRHKQLLKLTADYYYNQGREIADAQKRLGFSGFLKMDFRKLIGYISALGNWNDFNWSAVSDAVKALDQLCPKFYMPNNPNNGSKKHTWSTTGEYIVMSFDYLGKNEIEQYLTFYKEHFEPKAKLVKADSVRHELTELPHEHFSLEFIMWWD